jgi:hypothetical protein
LEKRIQGGSIPDPSKFQENLRLFKENSVRPTSYYNTNKKVGRCFKVNIIGRARAHNGQGTREGKDDEEEEEEEGDDEDEDEEGSG